MALSGVAALARGSESNSSTGSTGEIFFAFLLAILSHGLQAFQTILEEKFLHDENVNVATLTAYEGVWGSFFCIFVLVPICAILSPNRSFGIYENPIETFELLGGSVKLSLLVVAFFIVVTAYSFFGILVTSYTSAIQRNVYEMVRPLGVWVLSAFVYWQSEGTQIGEPIDWFTIGEVTGFIVTLFGVLVFERIKWTTKCQCCRKIVDGKGVSTTSLLTDTLNQPDEVETISTV
jgi:hypothetical protein